MKRMLLVLFLPLTGIAFLSQSCNKKGDPGNVVNAVDTFQLANADYISGIWALQTGSGTAQGVSARVATRNEEKITQKVFSSGTVLVYMKVPNGLTPSSTQYTLLPFTLQSFQTGYMIRVSYTYEIGKLRIYHYYEQTDVAGSQAPPISAATIPTWSFKCVVIPGSDGFRSSRPPVDLSDYEAVKAYYHLPD